MPDVIDTKGSIYQYAVKVIQGSIKVDSRTKPIGSGIYCTSVNVHNPWRHDVKYAIKLAVAGPQGKPGTISPFQIHQLKGDEVTEYDQVGFAALLSPISLSSFLEGYCVIESEEPLDVVGVYTGAAIQDERLGALHMERVPARSVPRCQDLKLNISSGTAQWGLTQVAAGSTLVVGAAPVVAVPVSSWAVSPNSKWLGSSKTGEAKGEYTYELEFCLCWSFEKAVMNFTVWTDNEATVFLNSTQLGTTSSTSFSGPGTPINTSSGFQSGVNKLKVVVKNSGGPTGMMLSGTFSASGASCS